MAKKKVPTVLLPGTPPPSPQQTKFALRKYVENFYDFQERRLQTEGRTTPKAKTAQIVLHNEDLVRLEQQTSTLKTAEKVALTDVAFALKRVPFYTNVLSDKKRYRGLGPTLAGVILSSFDIEREETVSQMWAFAGLAPIPCKRCNYCQGELKQNEDNEWVHVDDKWFQKSGCKQKTLGHREMYDSGKAMKPVKGQKLKYNKWLRAKLCGVLGGCLLKSSSPWSKFYYDYKNRKTQQNWGRSDNHRHKAAIRYMVKMLLLDIWKEWRTFEGLSVRPPYQEEYLKHVHHKTAVGSVSDATSVPWNGTPGEEESEEDEENRLEQMAIEEELALADKSLDELTE